MLLKEMSILIQEKKNFSLTGSLFIACKMFISLQRLIWLPVVSLFLRGISAYWWWNSRSDITPFPIQRVKPTLQSCLGQVLWWLPATSVLWLPLSALTAAPWCTCWGNWSHKYTGAVKPSRATLVVLPSAGIQVKVLKYAWDDVIVKQCRCEQGSQTLCCYICSFLTRQAVLLWSRLFTVP